MGFKNNITLIIISVALIAGGFGFSAPSMNEKAPLDTEPISYSQMTAANVSPGQRIQGDIPMNYGAYMEQYTKISGIRAGTDYDYYLIDLGSDGYIGVRVSHGNASSQFDDQSDETYAYLTGETRTLPTPISYNGVVQKATAFQQRYMQEYLVQMGYTEREAEIYTSKYIIEQEATSSSLPSMKTIGMIMVAGGFILLIASIVMMIIKSKNRIVVESEKKTSYTPYNPSGDPSNPFGDSVNGMQYSEQSSGQFSYNSMDDYEDDFDDDDDDDDDDDQPKSKFSLKLDD